jgi:archaeal flagellar protein FlaJ
MNVPQLGRAVAFVGALPRVRRLAERRSRRFATLLSRSGQIGNPTSLASDSIASALVAGAVGVPASLLAAVYLSPLLGLLSLGPLALYLLPELRLRDRTSERREGVERELPFFSILVNVLGGAGVSLYSIFESLAATDTFRSMRDEALLVKREVTIFGANANEAFEKLASNHPSKKFSDFLLGYTSKARSGGDLPSYLTGESGSLLRELEDAWSRYAARVGVIGSLMITVFGVVPLLLLVVGFFSQTVSASALIVFALLGVPLLASLLVLMAGRMQPVGERPLRGAWVLALVGSSFAVGVGVFLQESWPTAAAGLLVFFGVYGFSVRGQRREMKEVDDALPSFLKDMMEYKRQEYDMNRSIISLAAHRRYTPTFDRLLSQTAAQLQAGVPLGEVSADGKTRLGKIVFFVLGQMAYSGGGTVDTMFQLTQYTSKVIEMKKSAQAEMRPYVILSYVTPVLLVFGVSFVGGVLTAFGSSFNANASTARISLPVSAFHPELFQVADLLVVVSASALGVVGAKITDFTVRNTYRASTNLLVAVVAAATVPLLNLPSILHGGV